MECTALDIWCSTTLGNFLGRLLHLPFHAFFLSFFFFFKKKERNQFMGNKFSLGIAGMKVWSK